MATKQAVIADMNQGYARGGVVVEINQTKVIRARILLAYLEAYHPKEHALFIATLGDIIQSFEDERFVEAVLRYAEGFLHAHPEDQERLQSISPREMVEEVSQKLVEDAKTRRADIRRRASEIVNKYARGTTEKQELEDKLISSINASINKAETPQQLRTAIEEEVATMPLPTKEVVQQFVDADPLSAQHLLLTNPTRDSIIVGHITTLPAPAWRGYVAAVENLQMGPTETIEELINRAKEIGQTTAFLSADLSQTPAASAEPSGLISAILEAGGNKDALRVFKKLTEEARSAVSLVVVAEAWEKAVDAITRRAGGTLTPALAEIINQGNKHWENSSGKPLAAAGSAVAGVLGEILSPAFVNCFVNYVDAKSLLQKLGGQDGDRVAAFIKSLPDAQHDGGAATTALFLAITTTWMPSDVRFEWQQAQGGDGLGAWAIQIAKDSALEKLFSKFVKSKAVEAAGGVVKKGGASLVAGLLTKLGLSAAADVVITMIGTPVATAIKWAAQAAIWLGGYIWRPISNFLGKLTRGEIALFGAAQNAIKQTLDSWLGPRPPAAPKQWYEREWVLIALVVGIAVFLPMFGTMMLITSRDSALIEGFYSEPDRFIEDPQVYPPPDYLDINALRSKEFPCLSFGNGVSTQYGTSRALNGSEKAIIENTVENNPAIKALSCALDCSNRNVNISAFSDGETYVGYAPSALAGNIVFYPRMFGGFSEQSRARLLAHELAHNIDWFGGGLAEGYYPLSCGPTGKYPWKETPEEAFATAVELYITGNPYIRDFCGGKAYEYFGKTVAQCK